MGRHHSKEQKLLEELMSAHQIQEQLPYELLKKKNAKNNHRGIIDTVDKVAP